MADEPTGNLDEENSMQVLSRLEDLAIEYGLTLIMVTHDMEIAKHADRAI